MFKLDKKNVLITGASGGIGKEIASNMHKAGASLVISGQNIDVLQELSLELGKGVEVVPSNLSDIDSVNNLASTAAKALGGDIDILINNAGITKDNLIMRMKEEDWNRIININLTSTFILSRSVLRPMMKNKWGRIISISSVVGVTGNAGQSNYSASKAGMIAMAKSIAAEVATRGITVNCVAPGFIETPMTSALNEVQKQKIFEKIPIGRFGTPSDVANCVNFLSSEESSYITGQTIHINGGMAMI